MQENRHKKRLPHKLISARRPNNLISRLYTKDWQTIARLPTCFYFEKQLLVRISVTALKTCVNQNPNRILQGAIIHQKHVIALFHTFLYNLWRFSHMVEVTLIVQHLFCTSSFCSCATKCKSYTTINMAPITSQVFTSHKKWSCYNRSQTENKYMIANNIVCYCLLITQQDTIANLLAANIQYYIRIVVVVLYTYRWITT